MCTLEETTQELQQVEEQAKQDEEKWKEQLEVNSAEIVEDDETLYYEARKQKHTKVNKTPKKPKKPKKPNNSKNSKNSPPNITKKSLRKRKRHQ